MKLGGIWRGLGMKSEKWKTVRLKDLTTDGKGHYGIGAPAVEYKKNLYAYLRITDITDDGRINRDNLMSVDHPDAKKYLLKENDIVFARTGNSTGRSYFYDKRDGELVYAGFLIKFNLDPEKVNPKYIKLYTMTKEYKNWINSVATGSTRKNINAKMYGDMEIKLPPRQYQDYVVYTVEPLNEKIENNIQMIKTLERIAQVIFKHWFIDFEFPNENGEPYKSSGGEMVESEIGLIPKSWKVEILGDLIDFKKGKKPKKISEKPFEFSLPYLTIDVLNRNSIQYASQENTVQVSKKDILMVMDGASSGTLYFGMKGILGSTLAKIEINDTFPYQDFLYFLLKHYEKEFKSNLTGSAVPHTDKDFVKGLKFAVPVNDNLLKKADGLFSLIRDKLAENNEENVILKNLRDLLLPKLMSGEIRVPVESD